MRHLHEPGRESSSGSGLLPACDVRVRLIVALAAVVTVVMSTRVWFGLLALGACLAVAADRRLALRAWVRRLMGPLGLAAVLFLAQTFMTGSTPIGRIDLGPWCLTATQEGFWRGALVACRVLGSLGIVILLCQGAPAQGLLAALRWARLPCTWIEIAVLMHRYLHVFSDKANSVFAAQKARLGYAGLRRSLRSTGSLAGIVVLQSLDQAERSHEAMVARAYQGFVPLPSLPPLPRRQAAIGAGVVMVAFLYVLAERWPL